MLSNIQLEKILFLDIETVPCESQFTDMSEKLQDLWGKKTLYFRKEGETADQVYSKAGLYAEFGKIICISVGMIKRMEEGKKLSLISFYGDDETNILSGISKILTKLVKKPNATLCAHNGKEFDFPYIARRMLVNGLPIPTILNMAGKKPWETNFLDTMELWKFGDYKHYTSLELLTEIFGLPSPKDDINGSDIDRVYREEKNLTRIVKYCEKDVISTVQLFLKYLGQEIIEDKNIESKIGVLDNLI